MMISMDLGGERIRWTSYAESWTIRIDARGGTELCSRSGGCKKRIYHSQLE